MAMETAASGAPGMPSAEQGLAPTAAKPVVDNIDLLDDLQLTLTIELGRAQSTVAAAVELGEQSLIELDKTAGDPVDVLLNGKLFAHGEVVTVGAHFGVRITRILGRA